jgi:hypothetical protein
MSLMTSTYIKSSRTTELFLILAYIEHLLLLKMEGSSESGEVKKFMSHFNNSCVKGLAVFETVVYSLALFL